MVVDFGISGASIKVSAATKLLLLLIGKRINIILPWFGKPLVLTRAGELLNSGSRNLTPNLVHGPHYLLETKCYSAFTGFNNIYKSLKYQSKDKVICFKRTFVKILISRKFEFFQKFAPPHYHSLNQWYMIDSFFRTKQKMNAAFKILCLFLCVKSHPSCSHVH